MARILILANNDIGLYKFRKELIEELLKKHDVYVSLPEGELVNKLEDMGCIFINTKVDRRGTNPLSDLRLLYKYKAVLKKVKPDIVLTYTIKPNIYGGIICRITKTPYIVNITGLGTAVENGGILQKLTIQLYKTALKNVTHTFFQNRENQKFICNRIPLENFEVIPGSGVNLSQYSFSEYPKGDKIHFLFVARIMKEKGIDQYLDAAKYIKGKHPNTVFHVLGDCEQDYRNKLNNMHASGIIQYHGMQIDVKKFYQNSHCTIHPTYYPEGMSNVLLEASSSGRPIITTNRSGCKEIVDEGINGFIIKEQDSDDLISKIELFLSLSHQDRENMGRNGRAKMMKEFDRNLIVNTYMEKINKILNVN
ncbi:glycosyltransferase family 4 protein [Priestia megaterium]